MKIKTVDQKRRFMNVAGKVLLDMTEIEQHMTLQ